MIYFIPIGVNLNSQPPDFLRVSGITGNVNRHERALCLILRGSQSVWALRGSDRSVKK